MINKYLGRKQGYSVGLILVATLLLIVVLLFVFHPKLDIFVHRGIRLHRMLVNLADLSLLHWFQNVLYALAISLALKRVAHDNDIVICRVRPQESHSAFHVDPFRLSETFLN